MGELRQRTERMHSFPDLDRAQKSLDKLINYEHEPLVKMVPAGGGRRAVTYVHLLSGDVSPAHAEDVISSSAAPVQATTVSSASWREEMETAMAEMRTEISTLETGLSGVKAELSAVKSELGI